MNILAIDPGPQKSALVAWDGAKVHYAAILDNNTAAFYIRVGIWFDEVAAEMVASMGMAVGKEVFDTCVWVGRFMEMTDRNFTRITRHEIKMHLCGSMRAKDANIRQALIDRFGAVGTKKQPGPLYGMKSHLWSALAVGVTHYDRRTAT